MEETIEKMWQMYDVDEDGYLNHDQARDLVISTLKDMKIPTDLLSDEAFDAIFEEFDQNGEGIVSKDAIVAFFSTFMDFCHSE
ncbi:hypothetical protein THRCLA_22173 [Thraustotheca clavata]|uniref:EF-hand domain-containing protein n=1 Tax=Thraustotheca clavata TaxID=74557 RepID=A0A1V9ZAZ1_9STRA|nr:hypothetical protein THRCLA_22173 [Thraustotheca clavata]